MKDCNFWLFQGGPETEWLLKDDSPFVECFWTANKHVKKDDIALIYLTAPLSRIVASTRILAEPFFNASATTMFDNPFMNDKWCVQLGETVYLGRPSENCSECGRTRNGHALAAGWHEDGACDVYKKPDRQDWPLSIANLRKLFGSDWGWVRYPRGSTRIPEDIEGPLLELLSPYLPEIAIRIELPEEPKS